MNQLPKYIIVDLKVVFQRLDKLSTIDIDSLLSGMVQAIQEPNLTEPQLIDVQQWLLVNHHLSDMCLEIEDMDEAEVCIYECLDSLRESMKVINPYINGKLPYRYKERRGQRNAILQYECPQPDH
jgi:hypothetical protein